MESLKLIIRLFRLSRIENLNPCVNYNFRPKTGSATKAGITPAVPDCSCFPADRAPPEPGPFYTHLGSAKSLAELRKNTETVSGIRGKGMRIEKVNDDAGNPKNALLLSALYLRVKREWVETAPPPISEINFLIHTYVLQCRTARVM